MAGIDSYLVLRALHIIAFVAWMAGLFYLPRLFVYHCRTECASEASALFSVMERKLFRIIMIPAMLATWLLGGALIYTLGWEWFLAAHWLHVKLAFLLVMQGFHEYLGMTLKAFAQGRRPHSEKFYRIINEIPTLLLIAIVFLAVLKPV